MDKLIINNAKFQCFVGTQPEELTSRQEVTIYTEMEFDIAKSAETDELIHTIDYRDVNKRIEIILENRHNLIETIAENIAKDLLNIFDIDKILVKVNKPGSLKNAKYCSVEITRCSTRAKELI